jgi:hypothetical protein
VNRGNAAQAGHALDANPGRGTGGQNQASGQYDAGGYADAVITGNVTGLARFRGYSPVVQNNSFRVALPSAGLSSFEGASVGLDDVLSNRGPAPTRYYGVQQTVSDVGYIRAGMNAPGSSRLASPYVTLPRGGVATGSPSVSGGGMYGQTTGASATPDMIGVVRQEVFDSRAQSGGGTAPLDRRFQRAAGSSIFGVPPSPLARERRLWERPSPFDRMPGGAAAGLPEIAEEEPGPAAVGSDAVVTPPGKSAEPAVGPAEPQGAKHVPGGVAQEVSAPPLQPQPTGPAEDSPQIGADRFSDLLGAMRAASAQGKNRMILEGGGETAVTGGEQPVVPSAGPAAPRAHESETGRRRPVLDGVADLASAVRWAGELLENPVSTFAGRNRDRLNGYVSSGEDALRNGEYYRAADLFELAETVDPRNPLPWLHRGHALLAAGQYMSASGSLQQGIARFPQIAAFRLDLPSFGGQQAVFDSRRADLERRLAVAESFELRFLLGYLELYSGLPEEGLRDLDVAAKAAPPDSIISVFADLVSGRREIPAPADSPGGGGKGRPGR